MAYDIVIKNGNVIDGFGKPAIRGDMAIKDGKSWRVAALTNRPRRLSMPTG